MKNLDSQKSTYVKFLVTLTLFLLPLMTQVLGAEKPRVLILGDNFYKAISQQAAKALEERAVVVGSPQEATHSGLAVVMIDKLLGKEKWDIIYFNFGLGDLTHRAPGMNSYRVMSKAAGGVRTTSPKDYQKNLTELVKRLKKTGAKLVWASTTPIRKSANGIIEPGSETEYNTIASRVMKAHNIPINDMHAKVSKIYKEKPDRAEPYGFGKKVDLHPLLVEAIKKNL